MAEEVLMVDAISSSDLIVQVKEKNIIIQNIETDATFSAFEISES